MMLCCLCSELRINVHPTINKKTFGHLLTYIITLKIAYLKIFSMVVIGIRTKILKKFLVLKFKLKTIFFPFIQIKGL